MSGDQPPIRLQHVGEPVEQFSLGRLTVTGFVVERADGTRQFVNVDMPADLSMSERDAVFDGLQRLLEQGRVVGGRAVSCGAGGRVLTLESIR